MNFEDRVTKEYVEDALASKCEVVIGAYTGTILTVEPQPIYLGFRPKAVIVFAAEPNKACMAIPGYPSGVSGSTYLRVTATGFEAGNSLNGNDGPFRYVAFK